MRFRVWLKKLCFPPVWTIVLLSIISAAGLIYVFVKGMIEQIWAIAVYVVSFYTLCVDVIYCAIILPKQYRNIKHKIYSNPLGNRYLTDTAFKTHISLYISLTVNLLFVVVNIFSWQLYDSVWFVLLAVYYFILATMRFLLVKYIHRYKVGENHIAELKTANICSYILLLVNLVLSDTVLMILYQNKGFEYHGILIYVMASYTFYITTHTIVDLIRYRKYKSPVMTVSKIISLSAALVSMLSLETAMLSQFGADMSVESKQIMIILTGAGVSITVIALSLYMIVKTAKEIEEIKINGRK